MDPRRAFEHEIPVIQGIALQINYILYRPGITPMIDINVIVDYLRSPNNRIKIDSYALAPQKRGLYCFWHDSRPLYAGKSGGSLQSRIGDHIECRQSGDHGLCKYIKKYRSVVRVVPMRLDISLDDLSRAEMVVINTLKPVFNGEHV